MSRRASLLLVMCGGCSSDVVLLGDGRPVDFPVFGEPALLDINSENHDDDPTLTADLLEMFFSSEREQQGTASIYTTTRSSVGDAWAPPTRVAELSTDGDDGGCAISPNGLVIYLSRTATDGETRLDVWRSTRTARGQPWNAPTLVPDVNTTADDLVRWIDDEETQLLFGRRVVDGAYDLRAATRSDPSEPWVDSPLLDAFNTPNNEADPFLALGGQLLVFASAPSADDDNDLIMARRDPASGDFADAQLVAQLNSDAEDTDPWLAADARYVVFASRRVDDVLHLFEAFAVAP